MVLGRYSRSGLESRLQCLYLIKSFFPALISYLNSRSTRNIAIFADIALLGSSTVCDAILSNIYLKENKAIKRSKKGDPSRKFQGSSRDAPVGTHNYHFHFLTSDINTYTNFRVFMLNISDIF